MSFKIEGFSKLSRELDELATKFETKISDENDEKRAIQRGVTKAMESTVVPEGESRVPVRTGRLKESIDHESLGWRGDTYNHNYG